MLAVSISRLQQQTKVAIFQSSVCRIGKHGDMETWRYRHGDMETWIHRHGDIDMETETEAQGIFINPFTVCSS